ncbi:MAG TPA: hypothetical protein VGB06_09575, partial [Solirubrobacterales bacterium]
MQRVLREHHRRPIAARSRLRDLSHGLRGNPQLPEGRRPVLGVGTRQTEGDVLVPQPLLEWRGHQDRPGAVENVVDHRPSPSPGKAPANLARQQPAEVVDRRRDAEHVARLLITE